MATTYYLAYLATDDEAFSESAHAVEGERVYSFEIEHNEGDFPVCHAEIRNPRIGFLNAGRDQWVILWEDTGESDGATELFRGRILGVPEDIHAEEVRVSFIARPADWDGQRETLAAGMREAPYFDRVWIAEDRRDDPDAVLDARSALWHIDRVTNTVSASDIITGEDGTIDIAGDFFYDSLSITYNAPPARRVEMEAEVSWTQAAAGSVDLTNTLIAAFKDAGTTASHRISTYTGEGLQRDWPTEGTRIGAGWSVGETDLRRVELFDFQTFYYSILLRTPYIMRQSPEDQAFYYQRPIMNFPLWLFWPTLNVTYEAERTFSEKVTFTLEADVQALVAEPGDEEVIRLAFASRDVGEPIDPATTDEPNGVVPLDDVRRRSYFNTDRGHDSFEWLLARARAELLQRARAVEVAFETKWENGLALSCRKNVRIADSRLPGGEATGKVISYTLHLNGDTGEKGCAVIIGCTIGEGQTVTAADGTPDYVEAGYVVRSYQTHTGEVIMPIADEVTYDAYTIVPNDDGIDFHNMKPANVLIEDSDGNLITVNGGQDAQEVLFDAGNYNTREQAANALDELYTEFCINLKPLNTGPFDDNEHAITVSDLMVPKTIDLSAGSTA